MTETFYRTENYNDPTRFGGLIYPSDFNTDFRGNNTHGSEIAARIMSDMKFDMRCKHNIENMKLAKQKQKENK